MSSNKMSSIIKTKLAFTKELTKACTDIIEEIAETYNELPDEFDVMWNDVIVSSIKPPEILDIDDVNIIVAITKQRVATLIHKWNQDHPINLSNDVKYPDISEIQDIQINNSIHYAVNYPESPHPVETSSAPETPAISTIEDGKSEVSLSVQSAPVTGSILITSTNTPRCSEGDSSIMGYEDPLEPLYRTYIKTINKQSSEIDDITNAASENLAYIINGGNPVYAVKQRRGNWKLRRCEDFERPLRNNRINIQSEDDDGNTKTVKMPVLGIIRPWIPTYSKANNYYGQAGPGKLDLMNFPKVTFNGTMMIFGNKSLNMEIFTQKGIEIMKDQYGNVTWTKPLHKVMKFICEPILRHIRDVYAAGNKNHYYYIMAWIADMLKNPNNKPGVALFIIGKQGIGKGIFWNFFINKVLGPQNGLFTSNSQDIGIGATSFNGPIAGKILCVLDEMDKKGGIKTYHNRLKNLITEPTVMISEKYQPTYTSKNNARIVGLSNYDDPTIVEGKEDRRNASFEGSDIHIGDREYFRNLYKVMKDSITPMAFTYLLTNWKKLDDIELRDIPETESRKHMQECSMPSHLRFLKDIVSGETETSPPMKKNILQGYATSDMFDWYQKWCSISKSFNSSSRTTFTRLINKTLNITSDMVRLVDGRRLRGWKLSRSLIAEKIGVDVDISDKDIENNTNIYNSAVNI